MMHEVFIQNILNELEQILNNTKKDLNNYSQRGTIPYEPGWYLIKTNTPIGILQSVGEPQYEKHINIPKTTDETVRLQGITIKPIGNEEYVVYSGKAGTKSSNLNARASAHFKGHSQTNCISISDYKILLNFDWSFFYAPMKLF